ncbi:MAG: hypothetical protein ACI4U2_02255 [Christensenellaceae bacterium]
MEENDLISYCECTGMLQKLPENEEESELVESVTKIPLKIAKE